MGSKDKNYNGAVDRLTWIQEWVTYEWELNEQWNQYLINGVPYCKERFEIVWEDNNDLI